MGPLATRSLVLVLCVVATPAGSRADATADRARIIEALATMGLRASDTRLPIQSVTDDVFRIALVDSLLDLPLQTPALVESLAALTREIGTAPLRLGRSAALRLLAGVPAKVPPSNASPGSWTSLSDSLARAGISAPWRERILRLAGAAGVAAQGDPNLRAELVARALEEMAEEEDVAGDDPFEMRYRERREMAESDAFYASAAHVDAGALVGSRLMLLEAIGEWIALAGGAGADTGGLVPCRIETALGAIVIASPGDDRHDGDPFILIEPGGDDSYPDGAAGARLVGPGPGSPVRIVIDLAGDDVYRGEAPASLAAGAGGTGVLVDLAGNDTYRSARVALGAGVLGVGVLVDVAGDDVYEGESVGQAAAFLGLGMLLDGSGNDLYSLGAYGQAYGGVAGIAVLRDYAGGDRYVAAPVFTDVIRYEDHHISFLQGAAFGSRPDRSGGIGLLVDDGGNDTYQSDIFGQGVSYWFGLGALVDRGGHDVYAGYQYSQGAGVHLSVGLLLDEGGQDLYHANGVSQGCGHDLAAGLLVDRTGNDSYVSGGLSQGAGNANGVGILFDGSGEDAYLVRRPENSMGYGNPRRGTGSIGLMLDGRGTDAYTHDRRNGSLWWGSTVGSGIDDPSEMTPEEVWPPDPEVEVDPRAYDDEELFVLATMGPPKFRALKNDALERLVARGAEAMPALLGHMSTRIPRERHGIKDICVAMGELSIPFLASVLDTGTARSRRLAAWSLGYVGSPLALEPLHAALASEEGALRVEAASAIAIVARSDSSAAPMVDVPALAALLDESEPNLRRAAAFALGALRRDDAIDPLVGALSDPFFHVRLSAADGLIRLGDRSVAALASAVSEGSGEGRVFALRALEHLCPDERAAGLAITALWSEARTWPEGDRLAYAKAVATLHALLGDEETREVLDVLARDTAWTVASVAREAIEGG